MYDLNKMYDSLRYPLLFPFVTSTYRPNVTVASYPGTVSIRQYYAYYLMIRSRDEDLHIARHFYLQFIVDADTKIESNRVIHHCNISRRKRTGNYQAIMDQMYSENLNYDRVGQRIILPPSYTNIDI